MIPTILGSITYNSAGHSKSQYIGCGSSHLGIKRRPQTTTAAMGQVSDNAAMGAMLSKEMQPVALRSIKKVVRTGFADNECVYMCIYMLDSNSVFMF